MTFLLAPGISFCEADDSRIFLDVGRDRYFSLGPAADAAFAACKDGLPLAPDQSSRLTALAVAGILVDTMPGSPLVPCQAATIDRAPLEDGDWTQPGGGRILAAAWTIWRARLVLRMSGLGRLFAHLQACKRARAGRVRDATIGELADRAYVYAAAGRVIGTFDQCLPLSCALLRHCLAVGIAADLVLGIKLRPFQAHAWVVAGGTLISDRWSTVRQFTPILVL